MRLFLIGIVCISLFGCSMDASVRAHFKQEVNDRPAAYQEGYADGCQSAYHEGGLTYYQNHPKATDAAPLFAQGWDDGFTHCHDRIDPPLAAHTPGEITR